MGEFYTLSRTNKSMPSKSFQFTSFDIFLHNLSKLLNVFPFNHILLYYSSPQCYFPTQHTVSNGYHRDVLHVFVIWTKTTRMFAENNNLPNPSCFLCATITKRTYKEEEDQEKGNQKLGWQNILYLEFSSISPFSSIHCGNVYIVAVDLQANF